MDIKKNIKPFNQKDSFTIFYMKSNFEKSDSTVAIYDTYKISILLTYGLAAVVNDTVIDVGKNNILFFRPDEIHFGRFFRSGIHEYLDFYIPLTFFESFCTSVSITSFLDDKSENRVNSIRFDDSQQKRIEEIARKSVDMLLTNDDNNVKYFSMMLQIVLLCSDFYDKEKNNPSKAEIPKFVSQTLSYINKHFNEKISLDLLATNANCSIVYLSRVFKQYIGVSIYKHITDTRINNAQKMLKEGATVTEACFASGYDDCSNFIRTFKKITGKTPLKYKMS